MTKLFDSCALGTLDDSFRLVESHSNCLGCGYTLGNLGINLMDTVGIFQKSATSSNFETADSDHNSNILYTAYHDLLKGPIIMVNSLKDTLT